MFQPVGKSENDGDCAMSQDAREYLRDCPDLEAVYYAHWCLDKERPATADFLEVLCWSARSRFGYSGKAGRTALRTFYQRLMGLKPTELDALAHSR